MSEQGLLQKEPTSARCENRAGICCEPILEPQHVRECGEIAQARASSADRLEPYRAEDEIAGIGSALGAPFAPLSELLWFLHPVEEGI